jgi:hypothetical protein
MAWSSSAGDGRLVEESSCRRHDLLLQQIRLVALRLIARTQLPPEAQGYISDAEALALLFEEVAPLYQHRFGPLIFEQRSAFIEDLGIVVGGIEIRGNALEHAWNILLGDFQIEDAYRIIRADNPLSQYYIGYDNFFQEGAPSGFRDEFGQDQANQVRHFVGGMVGASAFGGLGRYQQLEGEREEYDRALYQQAYMLVFLYRHHTLDWGGQFVRENLME